MRSLPVYALVGVLAAGLPSQASLRADFDDAVLAWDAGDYVSALSGFERILGSPGGALFLQDIALLTGELYEVTEIAPDGRSIQMSGSGRFAAYGVRGAGVQTTHVVRLEGLVEVAQLQGESVVFSPTEDSAALLSPGAAANDGSRLAFLDLATRTRIEADTAGMVLSGLAYSPDGHTLYATGANGSDASSSDIYAFRRHTTGGFGVPEKVTSGDGYKTSPMPAGGKIAYVSGNRNPFAFPGGRRGRGRGGAGGGVVVVQDLQTGALDSLAGSNPTISADGSMLAFARASNGQTQLVGLELNGNPMEVVILETSNRFGPFALSPDGSKIVYQMMLRDDWELFVAPTSGGDSVRLTREIQHDLNPVFLDNDTVLGLIGESRHRRSHTYDLGTLERTRLFHNNTVRTIAPEYEWTASADGSKVMIVSERDGDTVSPERAVYVVDRKRRITLADLQARIRTSLDAELDLRQRGEAMFAPIADGVRQVTEDVSIGRLYRYQKSLYDFDSKNISQPGNALARDYIFETFESFGYEPELQWFTPRSRGGGRARGRGRGAQPGNQGNQTANVLATLVGTENPELIYIISSHFDSTTRGPGADDNTSGTSVTIEAARVLAEHPQPVTIVFAAFTGEESGLLGSREWVRQAVESGLQVVGALNNDMLGWSNNHRLDNTIRYSNKGIRDVQHSAAFLFSDLITYDALYYKSTDAAAYYDAYGDIVGGIGSYPVLGNPHYHQPTDHLETMNHELIAATCKTTVATLMLLASSPSRINGLEVVGSGSGSAEIRWTPSPENSVVSYEVVYGPANNPLANQMTVTEPSARLTSVAPGSVVAVRATNSRGLKGWDWAQTTISR